MKQEIQDGFHFCILERDGMQNQLKLNCCIQGATQAMQGRKYEKFTPKRQHEEGGACAPHW